MRPGAEQKSAETVSQKSTQKSDKTLKNDLAVWKKPEKGLKIQSHPSRVRGLKCFDIAGIVE